MNVPLCSPEINAIYQAAVLSPKSVLNIASAYMNKWGFLSGRAQHVMLKTMSYIKLSFML